MSWIFLSLAIFSSICASSAAGENPYFPEGVLDPEDRESSERTAARYAKYLRAMGEPPLWKLSKDDHMVTVHRLLWLPSSHPPISVRIVKSGQSIALHVARLEGTGSEEPKKVSMKQTKKLSEDEWTTLQVDLARSQYWKMKTSVEMNLTTGLILDGDHLICEGVDGGKYHVVDRSDPDPDYEKLCRLMLNLSELDIKEAWSEYHGEDRADKSSK